MGNYLTRINALTKILFSNNKAPYINDTNLNAMQNNTENAIRAVEANVETALGAIDQKYTTIVEDNLESISELNEKIKTIIEEGQECATNEFIDGKQVYAKQVSFTMPNAVNTWGLVTTIEAQSKLVSADLFVAPSNEVYKIPHARGNETMSFYYNKSNGKIYVDTNYSYPLNKAGWGLIKYTKNE